MKPDRSNYEIWLTDWLDGNLTEQQIVDLMVFLNENPDIREEVDFFPIAKLSSSNIPFSDKEHLRKSAADFIPAQIEYLSAGYLEKDLLPDQETDLKHNIELNHQNKIVFELIQKTKLSPPRVQFRNKNKLKKLTIAENTIRLSVIGLSAAAAISFLVLNYILVPPHNQEKPKLASAGIIADTAYIRIPVADAGKQNKGSSEKADKILIVKKVIKPGPVIHDNEAVAQIFISALPDSLVLLKRSPGPEAVRISYLQQISISGEHRSFNLIAAAGNLAQPAYDDERSGFSKFIAKTFREKILKYKTDDNSPLQPYEIAKAGINGLNSLLGWEMALVKTNDEAGELKSIYFSSKVLKFNAPVKKMTESK